MEDKTLINLQKYLEYIRYNTTDFGLRLLEPFQVHKYQFNATKYQAIFDTENYTDCYWVAKIELENFLSGKYSSKVNLKMDRPFKEDGKSGFYLSLSSNNLEPKMETIQKLFGLRFKKNDIFYKIIDVSFQKTKAESLGSVFLKPMIQDNVKIYTVEDFQVGDFLEVNKFVDVAKTVKKGVGYSIEIDGESDHEYVSMSDAKVAIEMAKDAARKDIINDISELFPEGHRIGNHIKEIIKKHLS
jgi:hypothetical protein